MIYNTHTTANENGHVNDNTNTIKYAEFNRDSLLDLAEKHYENLVEALTKNAIDIAASGSSLNTTLSLPHSSSTLPSSENQSDTHRKEEPKFYHNNKGDIAD